jgi:hypothetical protein
MNPQTPIPTTTDGRIDLEALRRLLARPTCPIDGTPLRCPACAGRAGGRSTSPRKRKAARRNLATTPSHTQEAK